VGQEIKIVKAQCGESFIADLKIASNNKTFGKVLTTIDNTIF
jgi:hypothetical protein